MNRTIVSTAAIVLAAVGAFALGGGEKPKSDPAAAGGARKIRVGLYESRAIAVAYANSRFNTRAKELTVEFKAAEAAGDSKKMAELKEKGEKLQDLLHRQGFGKHPVDNCLLPIKEALPRICQAAGVELIAGSIDYAGPSVETVDVTSLLVKEFAPSERVLKMVSEIGKTPPLEFDRFPLKE